MRLVIFFLILYSAASKSEPKINITYKYYSIKTTSAHDLYADLNHSSPIKEHNQIFHGRTDTNINWYFWWATDNGNCRISKVSTDVEVIYTLPKLLNESNDDKLKEIWIQWYPALVKHEENHAAHAVSIAYQIEDTIRNITPAANCKKLETLANKAGNKLIMKLHQIDAMYDKKTEHGKTEGAALLSYL